MIIRGAQRHNMRSTGFSWQGDVDAGRGGAGVCRKQTTKKTETGRRKRDLKPREAGFGRQGSRSRHSSGARRGDTSGGATRASAIRGHGGGGVIGQQAVRRLADASCLIQILPTHSLQLCWERKGGKKQVS